MELKWGFVFLCVGSVHLTTAQNNASGNAPGNGNYWFGACDTIWDAVECNSTSNCYFASSGCTAKAFPPPRQNTPPLTQSWCYQYFPFEVTVALYFLNCFTTGVGFMGAWYNVFHFNRSVKIDPKTRLKYKNRMKGYQHIMFVWCLLFVCCGVVLCYSAFMYFINPDHCLWVYSTYAYGAILFFSSILSAYWLHQKVMKEGKAHREQEKKDRHRVEQLFDNVALQQQGVSVRYL